MAKILSIEDDADLQHLIGRVLFQEGYEMHYAWNGREGYEKVLQADPDLVLLDLMLPIMNGIEVLEQLKSNRMTHDIPVVIVTAYGDEADMLKQAVGKLGAVCYVRKPVRLDELVGVVRRTLARFPRQRGQDAAAGADALRRGCFRADPKFMTVWIEDRLIATLPHKEFALLQCLMTKDGPLGKESLLRSLDYGHDQGDALKQAIHRLRVALGPVEGRRVKSTPSGYELLS